MLFLITQPPPPNMVHSKTIQALSRVEHPCEVLSQSIGSDLRYVLKPMELVSCFLTIYESAKTDGLESDIQGRWDLLQHEGLTLLLISLKWDLFLKQSSSPETALT